MNKSWTKYGGGRGGNEAIYSTKDWFCQSCQASKTDKDLVFTSYWREVSIRICEDCAKNDCEPMKKRLANIQ